MNGEVDTTEIRKWQRNTVISGAVAVVMLILMFVVSPWFAIGWIITAAAWLYCFFHWRDALDSFKRKHGLR